MILDDTAFQSFDSDEPDLTSDEVHTSDSDDD